MFHATILPGHASNVKSRTGESGQAIIIAPDGKGGNVLFDYVEPGDGFVIAYFKLFSRPNTVSSPDVFRRSIVGQRGV